MPVLAVKSLPSSTRAFAGSQAAQHNVSDLPSACAFSTGAETAKPAAIRPTNAKAFVMCVLPLLPAIAVTAQPSAPPKRPIGRLLDKWRFFDRRRSFARTGRVMFSKSLIYNQRKHKFSTRLRTLIGD